MTTCKLIKKSYLDSLIERGDVFEINELIDIKEMALQNATDNVEYWASHNMSDCEFSINEAVRANLLQRQIAKLKAVVERF